MGGSFITLFIVIVAASINVSCEEPMDSSVVQRDILGRPFSSSTYFISGVLDPEGMLAKVQEEGLGIREAWIPNHDGPCLRLEVQQLVIRLAQADSAIFGLGFSQDSSFAVDSCTETWKHYKF